MYTIYVMLQYAPHTTNQSASGITKNPLSSCLIILLWHMSPFNNIMNDVMNILALNELTKWIISYNLYHRYERFCLPTVDFHVQSKGQTTNTALPGGLQNCVMERTIARVEYIHNSILTDPYAGCPKDFIIVCFKTLFYGGKNESNALISTVKQASIRHSQT